MLGLMAFETLDKIFGYIFAQYIIISSTETSKFQGCCVDRRTVDVS
jgi:hypothetical protein